MSRTVAVTKNARRVVTRPVPAKNDLRGTALARNAKPLDPNDPVPVIVAAIGVALAGSMLENVINAVGEGVTRPASAGIEYFTRLKTYELYRTITLDSMIAALKATIYTKVTDPQRFVDITDDQFRDAMDKIIRGTIMATAMVSEDAGEIVMEAFQEAFSNATYYGIGGIFATLAAYRGGFMPPQSPFNDPGFVLLDAPTKANLDALTGFNPFTITAQHVLRHANEIIDTYSRSDKLDSLLTLFSSITDLDLNMLANLERQYDTVIDYIIEQTRTALTILLRRTIDIRDTIRAAYADYKVNLIAESDMRLILVDAQLELREIRSLKDEILDDLDYVLTNIELPSDTDRANIASIIDKLETALDDYWRKNFSEMGDYLDAMKQAKKLIQSSGLTWKYISKKTGQEDQYTW